MKTVLMEEMSYPEVMSAVNAGYKTVIIAVGATEQHGPHLPLGTDTMMGYIYAKALAAELGNTLVAPIIPLGLSKAFMSYAGSLTFRPATLIAVLEDYVNGYIKHGFETIILLPAHVGNFYLMQNFANTAAEEYPGTKIICCLNNEVMQQISEQSYKEDGVDIAIQGSHAGESETSTMLECYPYFVDMSLAEEGFVGDFASMRDKMLTEGVQALSANGIIGDARPATAERGQKVIERMVKAFAEITRKNI